MKWEYLNYMVPEINLLSLLSCMNLISNTIVLTLSSCPPTRAPRGASFSPAPGRRPTRETRASRRRQHPKPTARAQASRFVSGPSRPRRDMNMAPTVGKRTPDAAADAARLRQGGSDGLDDCPEE